MRRGIFLAGTLFSMAAVLSAPQLGAQEQTADAAYREMNEMLGGTPSILKFYPRSAVSAGWALLKQTDLNKDTALPSKTRELIALGVAAQIPCQYCVYYHTAAAKAAGANDEELREAIHVASLIRHWSTLLQGNLYDLDAFIAETDAIFAPE